MHFLGTANLSAMINNDINPFLHLAFPACCKFSAFFCNFQRAGEQRVDRLLNDEAT
jgi:hypothetical protein